MLRCLMVLALAAPAVAADSPISKVRHEPEQPMPGATVLVTATVSAGTNVKLRLQPVEPGQYIRKTDAAYEKEWIDLPMHSDRAGSYSVRVPEQYQKHRWLVRYRIVVTTGDGKTVQSPPADSTSPNYAWWCDGGPAAWTGSREPGKSPPLTFSTDFLKTLPTLRLIARHEDVSRSQWDGNFNRQKMTGTIVYGKVVYDHIQFSNRGQGSTHISGKNKWHLKFNDSQRLTFFDSEIGSLNLNPGGSTPYLPVLRGIAGLDEVLSMRSYRLAGVPSPNATWIHWRVVTRPDEVHATDQFKGDLWGLYVAIGEMTPKLLADPKLPDGLTVSIQSGIKHTPPGMTDAQKVWDTFLGGVRSNPTEDWWRKNLDLPAYYSFHSMNRLLGNVDLRPDGNHGYYRNPDGHWAPIPWDNDMMFVPRQHQPGYIEAIACLNHSKIKREFRNRAREILDLFATDASEQGGQIGQLTADLGAVLMPKGYNVNWAKLDDALWNQHPRMNQRGTYYVNPARGDHFGGLWTRTLKTNDFPGFQNYIVEFCTDSRPKKNYAPNDGDQRGYGWGYLNHEAKDDLIPATPKIVKLTPQRFQATAFSSPSKSDAAALEWRVGRIGRPGQYELTDHWKKDGTGDEMTIAPEVFKEPGVYRVRARWRDSTGRCSHWSEPVEVRKP